MKKLLFLLGAVTITALGLIWNGYVLMLLWKWFIAGTFIGIFPLTLTEAIGLDLVVTLLMPSPQPPENEDPMKALSRSTANSILKPAVLLGIAAIVKHFL